MPGKPRSDRKRNIRGGSVNVEIITRGSQTRRRDACVAIAGVLSLAGGDVPVLPIPEVDQVVGTFDTACVSTFPDIDKTTEKAIRDGWIGFNADTQEPLRKGLPRAWTYFTKERFQITIDKSEAFGRRCEVSGKLGSGVFLADVSRAMSAALNLPPVSLDGRQNSVDWTFRNGRTISLSTPSRRGHLFALSVAERMPATK